MSPPERVDDFEPLGDLAAAYLARLWHQQHKGASMPDRDTVLAEARRHHAEVCRGYDPNAGDDQIAAWWNLLGPAGREGYLRTAEQHLTENVTR